MIKNIFIPEKIGSHYIFSKRIVGIDVGKTHVNATQIHLKGKQILIEKFVQIPLENDAGNNYTERASTAIKQALQQVDRYDELHTALSSSVVIFKELKLPFIGRDKIALVVEFEVEPLLPFSIHDAIIDFIVTREHTAEKNSDVLVAAVQKIQVAQHLQLFVDAGISPDVVTIDLFALYGVYKEIPSYAALKGDVALVDVGSQTTRLAYIHEGQLRFIRSLPKGITHIAKQVSDLLQIQPSEAFEMLVRFGLERYDAPSYTQATTTALTSFWNEISFTLNSFVVRDSNQGLEQIILVGGGAEIKGLPHFVTNLVQVPTELMRINELLTSTLTVSTKHGIPHANITSLCAALPTPTTDGFNLRKKEFSITTDVALLNKQLLFSGILAILLLGSLIAHNFLQVRKLTSEVTASQEEAISALKERFPKDISESDNLEDVVDQAKRAVDREEKLWFSIANPARIPFLEYMLELTSRIDKKALGFSIEKLTLTTSYLTMTAHVRDHAALAILEKELRKSKLFAHVEGQQNPSFTMKITFAKGA